MTRKLHCKSRNVFTPTLSFGDLFFNKKTGLKLVPIFLFMLYALPQKVFGEGTKELSPDPSQIASIVLNPAGSTGPYQGASQEDRIYFRISDAATENFYFGAGNFRTSNTGAVYPNVWMQIKNSAGAVVHGPVYMNGSQITSHAQAVAGVNIAGSVPGGFTPLTFDPSANGDYYIEFWQGTSPTNSAVSSAFPTAANNLEIPWFDFQVGKADGTQIDGRLYSEKWSLRANAVTGASNDYAGTFPDKVDPTFYAYSDDGTAVKVAFNDFQPLQFTVSFNKYGVGGVGSDWLVTRKSVNSGLTGPALPNNYKTFLNEPDNNSFFITTTSDPIIAGNIIGCEGNYTIPYTLNNPGDIRVVIDLNGIPGYQAGSRDVLIEKIDQPVGTTNLAWDGKDGLGNPVGPSENFSTTLTLLRGRINLPLYDAELNNQGFILSSVAPTNVSNLKMYWDDSGLANIGALPLDNNDNLTGPGINNSTVGQLGPGHAWDGTYGTTLLTAPANTAGGNDTPTAGGDDFGNLRTINTWFWALEESATANNMRIPGCLNVSGNVFKDANGLTDGSVNGTGSNLGGLNAVLVDSTGKVVATVPVNPDGTYQFQDIDRGTYNVILSTTAGVVGNPAPAPSLPAGFVSTGEGSTTPGDGTVNTSTSITLTTADISNVNFGVNELPNSDPKTQTYPNPGGTSQVTVPTLTGSDPEDGVLAATKTIVIKTLPTNGTLYYNGVPVVAGVDIPNYDPAKLTFDPSYPGAGTSTFEYVFKDAAGNEDPTPATVTLDFTLVPAVANLDQSNANPVGTTVTLPILTNDKLSSGATPTFGDVSVDLDPTTAGNQNILVVPGEGTWTYDSLSGITTFVPLSTFKQDPTPIVYNLIDKATGSADTALNIIDYVPVSVNDTANFAGSPVTVNVTGNDTGGDTIDPTTVTLVDPANPTVPATSVTVPGEGTWTVNPTTGAVTFTPEPGFVGSPTPIDYKVKDDEGNETTSKIILTAAPIANSDTAAAVPVGTVASLGNILTDDKKGDGTTPTPAEVTVDLDPATPGDQASLVVPGEGTWNYNPTTGVADFTPEATYKLDPMPIVYKLTETATGKSDTAMLYADYVPKSVNDTANFAGSPVTVNVTGNDTGGDTIDPTTVTLVDPANPTVPATSVTVPGEGTWTVNPTTGAVTFTPEPGFVGVQHR